MCLLHFWLIKQLWLKDWTLSNSFVYSLDLKQFMNLYSCQLCDTISISAIGASEKTCMSNRGMSQDFQVAHVAKLRKQFTDNQ